MIGGSDAAGDAGDFDGVCAGSVNLCAERLHAGEGGGAVCAGGEIGKARGALGEAAEHGVAMADGFVAGETKAADDVSSWMNETFLCGGWQDGSVRQLSAFRSRQVHAGRRGCEVRAADLSLS